MNNRKVNIIIGIVAAILAIVSIFTLFATCFGPSDSPASHPSTLGSCYDVMFGKQGFNAVVPLIIAFVLQIVAAVFILIGAFLPGKLGMFGLGIGAIAVVVAGILWLLAPTLFLGVNTMTAEAETVVSGTGNIVTAILCFVGGVLSLYGAYRAFKA